MASDRVAACCLVLREDGKVLAVPRKKDPSTFGMPGGKKEPGETLEECAAREFTEETGMVVVALREAFTDVDDGGYTTVTFECMATGEPVEGDCGKAQWVEPQVLFDGPFGGYNRRLWAHMGLRCL